VYTRAHRATVARLALPAVALLLLGSACGGQVGLEGYASDVADAVRNLEAERVDHHGVLDRVDRVRWLEDEEDRHAARLDAIRDGLDHLSRDLADCSGGSEDALDAIARGLAGEAAELDLLTRAHRDAMGQVDRLGEVDAPEETHEARVEAVRAGLAAQGEDLLSAADTLDCLHHDESGHVGAWGRDLRAGLDPRLYGPLGEHCGPDTNSCAPPSF
jgi:hypothetical protein